MDGFVGALVEAPPRWVMGEASGWDSRTERISLRAPRGRRMDLLGGRPCRAAVPVIDAAMKVRMMDM